MPDLRFIPPGRCAVLAAAIVLLVGGEVSLVAQEALFHPVSVESADCLLQVGFAEGQENDPFAIDDGSLIDSQKDSQEVGWASAAASSEPLLSLTTQADDFVELEQPIETVDYENVRRPYGHDFTLELLPQGLMFRSYLAGEKEPRFASQWLSDETLGDVWETALGGRWGIVRYGSQGAVNPQGFQLDFEGGVMARVIAEEVSSPLYAADFRTGIVGTWHIHDWRAKTGYYHLSSHAGDEFLIAFPAFNRINYVRDAWLAALMYDLTDELQVYGELAYALNANGGAEPLEIQFGAQFLKGEATGPKGFPFFAINNHWRQEFSGELATNIQAGWMWRGRSSDHIFRVGFHHYNGRSLQYQFYDQYENLNGFAIWFDY